MARSNSKQQKSHSWLWMFTGMVIGLAMFSLGYVFIAEYDQKQTLKAFKEQLQDLQKPYMAGAEDRKKEELEFYTTLTRQDNRVFSKPGPVIRVETPVSNTPKAISKKAETRKNKTHRSDRKTVDHKSNAAKDKPAQNRRADTQSGNKPQLAGSRAGEIRRPLPTHVAKAASAPGKARAPAIRRATASAYVLQAGAFRRSAQASRLKRHIGSMGLPCFIEVAQVKSSIYHRVRLGPFRSRGDMDRAMVMLKRENIAAFKVN